jgi:ureidoglycolate lyase
MKSIELRPETLTRERFAPYGDVIEVPATGATEMNNARFERFDGLSAVETDGGRVAISIARCRLATPLPRRLDVIERHPFGSQAIIPFVPCRFIVVVGPPGEAVAPRDLRAFITDGHQGINYHRGTWHMPLIGLEAGQQFLIIDRADASGNCLEYQLDRTVTLYPGR